MVVFEVPADARAEITRLFSSVETAAAGFASRGIAVEERFEIVARSRTVPVIAGTQTANGQTAIKYAALFRGRSTALVTFNLMGPEPLTREEVERTLGTVALHGPPALEERVAYLDFTFEVTEPFHVNHVMAGSVLLATFDGEDATGLLPLIVIARAMDNRPIRNLEQLSHSLILSVPDYEDAEIIISEPMVFAGGPAYWVTATTGDTTACQLLGGREGERYTRFIATGSTEQIDLAMPAIRAIAASVRVPR